MSGIKNMVSDKIGGLQGTIEQKMNLGVNSIWPLLTQSDVMMDPGLGGKLFEMTDSMNFIVNLYNEAYIEINRVYASELAGLQQRYDDLRGEKRAALKNSIDKINADLQAVSDETAARISESKKTVEDRLNSESADLKKWYQDQRSAITTGQFDISYDRSVLPSLEGIYHRMLEHLSHQAPGGLIFKVNFREEAESYYELFADDDEYMHDDIAQECLTRECVNEAESEFNKLKAVSNQAYRKGMMDVIKSIIRILLAAKSAKKNLDRRNAEIRKEREEKVEAVYKAKIERLKKFEDDLKNEDAVRQAQLEAKLNHARNEAEAKAKEISDGVYEQTQQLDGEEKELSDAIEKECKESCLKLVEEFNNRMEIIFPKDKVRQLFDTINEAGELDIDSERKFNGSFAIGSVSVKLPAMDGSDPAFEGAALKLFENNYSIMMNSGSTAKFPYFVSLDRGIMMMLKYDPLYDKTASEIVNMIGARVMMNAPASLLKFCLIDNDAVGSFDDILNLDPAAETRGMNDRIKSILLGNEIHQSSEAIRKQLGEMWTHYNTLISSIGGREAVLREFNERNTMSREAYQIAMIQHFPMGFERADIARLGALIRDCGTAGFSAVITQSKDRTAEVSPEESKLERDVDVLTQTDSSTFAVKTRKGYKCEEGAQIRFSRFFNNDDIKKLAARVLEESRKDNSVSVNFDSIVPEKEKLYSHDGKEGISVKLGKLRGGKDFIINMNDAHVHTILSGNPRIGKSNMLRVFITNVLMNYAPSDVELYLVDYKKGDDFSIFSKYSLPHLHIISLANEPDYVMLVLEELKREVERRSSILSSDMNINAYNREHPDVPLKRIILVIDELYVLLKEMQEKGNEFATQKVIEILDIIAHEHGAFGVHMFLAGQQISSIGGISDIVKMCANRLVLNTSSEDVDMFMPGRKDAHDLLSGISPEDKGVCVYTDDYGTSCFLGYTAELPAKEQDKKLETIEEHFMLAEEASYTDVLVTNPSLDKSHPLTQFIEKGIVPDKVNGMMIGQNMVLNRMSRFLELPKRSLWMIGGENGGELAGKSAIYYIACSLILMKIQLKKDMRLICCNGLDENLGLIEQDDYFGQICSDDSIRIDEECPDNILEYVCNQDLGEKIAELHKESEERIDAGDAKDHTPVWMIIQQLELCWDISEDESEMLRYIMKNSDKTNIHVIVWTKTPDHSEDYNLKDTNSEILVLETSELVNFLVRVKNLKVTGYMAQYIAKKGARMRIYNCPVIPDIEKMLVRLSEL